jgi:uncharacterized protein (TIGR02453 family)
MAMPSSAYFTPELFKFLRDLANHNNRDWFQENKWRYETFVRDPFLRFIEAYQSPLHAISPHFIADPKPVGGSLLRIYRDMRFRKDQQPYKTMVAARFPHRAYKQRTAPGLYLHLDPQHCFFACGLWRPDGDTRALVREAIVNEPQRWKFATRRKVFASVWEMSGESFARLPTGVDPNHPLAVDLKRKDFTAHIMFTEKQVCDVAFLQTFTRATRAAAPFIEFLTRAVGLPWSADEKPRREDPLTAR